MDAIEITDELSIPLTEVDMQAVRSRGAGGQNVNKVATAIHLRFDIHGSIALPERVKRRLLASGDRRISSEGVLIIKSQRHRSQDRNRQAALERLADLVRNALHEPKRRIATRPGKKARQKRLDDKSHRAAIKQSRRKITDDR